MFLQVNLGPTGWLDGITATLCVGFASVFGILMFIQSKRKNANLLMYGGLMGLFAGLLWLGPTVDFFTVLFTTQNLPSELIYGILSYMWVAPAFICAMYLGGELTFPEKKRILLIISVIMGVFFELLLFLDTNASFKDLPDPGGLELYDTRFEYTHPTFIIIAVILGLIFVLNGVGALRASLKASGVIKQRFLYLSFSFFLFIPVAIFDAFLEPGVILSIIRLLMIFVAWLMYLSLRIKI